MRLKTLLVFGVCLCFLSSCGSGGMDNDTTAKSTDYQDLINLFKEFRDYQKPRVIEEIPDYTKETMKDQYARLPEFRQKLNLIDPSGWTIPERVDYEVLRAEINGLRPTAMTSPNASATSPMLCRRSSIWPAVVLA